MSRLVIKYIIFYGSYLAFPFLVFIFWFWIKKSPDSYEKTFLSILMLLSIFFIWARFIERYWIVERYIFLKKDWNARIVFISDIHLGLYKNEKFLKRVIKKINSLKKIDAVLIAGDFIYEPQNNLEKLFAPFSGLKVPAIAVLGNHDVLDHGPGMKERVWETLEKNGVSVYQNQIVPIKDGEIKVYALGDNWEGTDNVTLLGKIGDGDKSLILTHNPDTTLEYPAKQNLKEAVTLVGHSHCGQSRLPYFSREVTPTVGPFYSEKPKDMRKKGILITSCGLGETGFPARLFRRPEILILDL